MGDSLKAFLDDLNQSGRGKRVLVLIFSEFGRRLTENGSGGTDHGTAAPVFLLGGGVKAGLHGPYPNWQDLQDGDPKHAIDFRRLYATVLDISLPTSETGRLGDNPVQLVGGDLPWNDGGRLVAQHEKRRRCFIPYPVCLTPDARRDFE